MAKKKQVTHEVVCKQFADTKLTKEMVDWLIAHGKTLEDNIMYHDPLLVQCVKELDPEGFTIVTIEGNKYRVIDLVNDSFIVTPKDIDFLKKSLITIEDPEAESETTENK